jgi:hypothetical protein
MGVVGTLACTTSPDLHGGEDEVPPLKKEYFENVIPNQKNAPARKDGG